MELDGLPSTVMPLPAVTLIFGLFTPKSTQHICEPKYIRNQNLAKFPSLVFEIHGCLSDAQTHSRTDTPEISMSPAPKVFSGRGKNAKKSSISAQLLQKLNRSAC